MFPGARGPRGRSGASAIPYGAPYGMRMSWVSATAVAIALGACRDSTDTVDIRPAAATVSITATGLGGMDQYTLASNSKTYGTATVDLTASIYAETPMTATVRTLTGTITTVGTACTGTGTAFRTQIAIGDVIRSATKGASRVTAIASDTACTLVAAFPGGNATTEAATAYENLTFWGDVSSANDKRRVNTIAHDGLQVIASSALTSNDSGGTLKPAIGVEVVSLHVFEFAVQTSSSGDGHVMSTQRTRPYPATGITAWRLVNALYNNASGDIQTFTSVVKGSFVEYFLPDVAILASGTATAYTFLPWGVACPPLHPIQVWLRVTSIYGSAGSNDTPNFVQVSEDGVNLSFQNPSGMTDNGEHGSVSVMISDVTSFDGNQGIYYRNSQAANSDTYINVRKWGFNR